MFHLLLYEKRVVLFATIEASCLKVFGYAMLCYIQISYSMFFDALQQ